MKLSLKFLTNQSVIWHQKTKNHTALTLYLCQWCWSLAFGKYCFTLSVQIVVTAYTASLRNVIEHKGILDSDLLTPVTYKITLSSWTGGGGGTVEVQLHSYLASALNGGEWSATDTGHCSPNDIITSMSWRARGLEDLENEKSRAPPGNPSPDCRAHSLRLQTALLRLIFLKYRHMFYSIQRPKRKKGHASLTFIILSFGLNRKKISYRPFHLTSLHFISLHFTALLEDVRHTSIRFTSLQRWRSSLALRATGKTKKCSRPKILSSL